MRGFTLIELIVIIIILGIIAVVAIPKVMDIGEVRLEMASQKVAADLKYAREFAMNHNCKSRVVFSAETYTVYEDSSGSWEIAQDPTTRDNFVVELNTGNYKGVVIETVDFDGGSEIIFNSIGVPYTDAGSLTSEGSVSISGGGAQASINVTPVTGRIYIVK